MSRITQFRRFLWDFVIGDDWRIALGVTVALIGTLVLSNNGVTTWWLLPIVVMLMLSISVWGIAVRARARR
jgi:hypothetical protein